jgi:hypothetical protein
MAHAHAAEAEGGNGEIVSEKSVVHLSGLSIKEPPVVTSVRTRYPVKTAKIIAANPIRLFYYLEQ